MSTKKTIIINSSKKLISPFVSNKKEINIDSYKDFEEFFEHHYNCCDDSESHGYGRGSDHYEIMSTKCYPKDKRPKGKYYLKKEVDEYIKFILNKINKEIR